MLEKRSLVQLALSALLVFHGLLTTDSAPPPLCASEDHEICPSLPEYLCVVQVVVWMCPHQCKSCGDVDVCEKYEVSTCPAIVGPKFPGACDVEGMHDFCPKTCNDCSADPVETCTKTCSGTDVLDTEFCACIPETPVCTLPDQPYCLIVKDDPVYAGSCDLPYVSNVLCPTACGHCSRCDTIDAYFCPAVNIDREVYCGDDVIGGIICPHECDKCSDSTTTPEPCSLTCEQPEVLNEEACTCDTAPAHCLVLSIYNWCDRFSTLAADCPNC